jgi:23S rRNA (adenine2503-C2)-methyltransferase
MMPEDNNRMESAANQKASIYDLDHTELNRACENWGEPAYRTRQIWDGLYKQYYDDPVLFSNLPKSLRAKLGDTYQFTNLKPESVILSDDLKTEKTLFRLNDSRAIEAVLMKYANRRTVCISSQSGCAMGCVFCATGQMGFFRNLSSGEIIEQILFYQRRLSSIGESVTNIVIMGMGEPLHNYDATLGAIDRMNDKDGSNFGARRFTISTVGLVPGIYRFTKEQRQVNLAVSLHAINDDLRTSMLPINKKYPLNDLLQACWTYTETTGRRITFEWALIKGLNDTPSQAHELGKQLKGRLCHVNVIPLNPTRKYGGAPSKDSTAVEFQKVLADYGISCTIRIRRGIDIQAGCGQLAIQHILTSNE